MTNLITTVAKTVASNPDALAIVHNDTELTYEQFWTRAGQFAAALEAHEIGKNDRIAIYLPNLPQFVIAFYGTLRAGGIVVPMNPQYKAREIGHLLRDSGAKAVISLIDNVPNVLEVLDDTNVEQVISVGGDVDGAMEFDEFLPHETNTVVDREDDDVAVQPYTSGTTGTPKGVLLTHQNIRWTTEANADIPDSGFQISDRLVGTLPLFHIYGMSVVMNGAMYSGGTYYPVSEWDAPAVMNLIEDQELTIMFGVPAMFNDMINQPDVRDYNLKSLRFVNSGGSSLPHEVLERFEELFGTALYEGYGLTETSPVTHANHEDARRKGSIGTPLEGPEGTSVNAKVVDKEFETVPRVEEGPIDEENTDLHDITGELVVSGPNVMKRYYNLPEANKKVFTEEDDTRWFHTGDVCYWDKDNFFFVVDREKHMIVTGGYNVYPREVEELLFEHEAVADAAVVGVPDERRGETVKALVVPTLDAEVASQEIKQYCLENMAEYKHPREVEFVEELPRTTTGKVQKFKIQD